MGGAGQKIRPPREFGNYMSLSYIYSSMTYIFPQGNTTSSALGLIIRTFAETIPM